MAASCPGLRDLDLSGNSLTDVGMADLVATLLQSDSVRLRRLNLGGNKFKAEGLRALAMALQANVWLEAVDLSDAGVDQRSLESFFSMLLVLWNSFFTPFSLLIVQVSVSILYLFANSTRPYVSLCT